MKLRRFRLRIALLSALLPGGWVPVALEAQQPDFDALAAWVEARRPDWKIPGMAVAIVKDDAVVFARGFGVRELGRPEPVDEGTHFAIGSASKAFTAAALAALVAEGELTWNERVTHHVPEFELFDPYVTREFTVLDLLTHRSGLPRGDAAWYATEFDRREVLRRVRHLEPESSFRSAFGYQNIMFIAAGEILPSLTGLTWDEWVEARIFQPLGMTESSTSTLGLPAGGNVATPHAEVEGEVRPIAWRNIDNAGPAGSINSNVVEMANWVRMHLAEGSFQGNQVLPPQAVSDMQASRTLIRPEGGWALMAPTSRFMTYGLGWFLNDYRGHLVVQHGGNIDGMHALVGMMPEEELGIVILTNLRNQFTHAIMYRVFDLYLGGEQPDWSARLKASSDSLGAEGRKAQEAFEAARATGTTPSLAPSGYQGDYQHPMYGDARVTQEGGTLLLTRGPAFVGELVHWHHDTFQVRWRDPSMAPGYVTFTLNPDGTVAGAEVQGLGLFRRVAEGG
jgi:CubicO group peptidase (beta-lactamase class C family)